MINYQLNNQCSSLTLITTPKMLNLLTSIDHVKMFPNANTHLLDGKSKKSNANFQYVRVHTTVIWSVKKKTYFKLKHDSLQSDEFLDVDVHLLVPWVMSVPMVCNYYFVCSPYCKSAFFYQGRPNEPKFPPLASLFYFLIRENCFSAPKLPTIAPGPHLITGMLASFLAVS